MTNLALDDALVTNIQVLYLTEVPDGLKLNIGGLYSFVLQPTKIKFQTNALIHECKQTGNMAMNLILYIYTEIL